MVLNLSPCLSVVRPGMARCEAARAMMIHEQTALRLAHVSPARISDAY